MPKGLKSSYVLIELVIVMVVMALLASWGVSGFVKTNELSKEKSSRITTKSVADFLMQYSATYKRLPCPARGDTEHAIEEDCSLPCDQMRGVFCANDFVVGVLPYKSIFGDNIFGKKDGWGYKFTYIINKNLAASAITKTDGLQSSIFVRTDGIIDFANAADLTPIAFAVMSHGKEHRGAWSMDGKQSGCVSANGADEIDIHNCSYTNPTNNQFILMYFAEHSVVVNAVLGTKSGKSDKFFYDDIIEWRSMDEFTAQITNP